MSNTSKDAEDAQAKVQLSVPQSLKIVLEILDKMCEDSSKQAPSKQCELLLQSLNYKERFIVAEYFCKLLWNISSVRVLGCLNRLRILTATEYILSQTDDEHIQLVLNDFLETEFDLISNLITCGHYDLICGSRITEYIDEAIRRLFADLTKDPKLNNFEYISALKKNATDHVKTVLSMYPSTTKNAFANFTNWLVHNLDKNVLTQNFYDKAIATSDKNIVQTILNISADNQFKGWKNYLCLLASIIKHSSQHCTFVKKWLKDRLKFVADSGSVEVMAHVLLSIRVVCMFENSDKDNYAKWYKQNIGDMKFIFDANQFKTMITVLTNLLPYETDQYYLEVHVGTSISPPVMCGQICRDYKLFCRTRISDILENSEIIELDEDLFPGGV